MRPLSSFSVQRAIEGLAALVAPRHRGLVRAMLSELEAIGDRAERRRFALGAFAAIGRLAASRYIEALIRPDDRSVDISEPGSNPYPRDPTMTELSTRQLLGRHVIPFAVTLALLTGILLTSFVARRFPQLSGREELAGTLLEALLLALPSAMGLTIPMAVFIAVVWVFMRLGRDGVLEVARREAGGIRRLIAPVLGVAALITAVTFVSNAEILPRANARYTALVADSNMGAPRVQSDRSMTIGELRDAARRARAADEPAAAARAAAYEVEIQKKYALAAASLVLALAGTAIALRYPRGGVALVLGASAAVFTGYYMSIVVGEALADMQVRPPVVAMWMANAILFGLASFLVWRWGSSGGRHGDMLAPGG